MRLKSYREHIGLTRAVVCERCGISRSALARIEAGISIPSIELLIRLSISLGVRLPSLLLRLGVIRRRDTVKALSEIER